MTAADEEPSRRLSRRSQQLETRGRSAAQIDSTASELRLSVAVTACSWRVCLVHPNDGPCGGPTLVGTWSMELSATNPVFKMMEPTTGVEPVTYALPRRPLSDRRWPATESQRIQRPLSRVAARCGAHWWWNGSGQPRLRTRSMALAAGRRSLASRGLGVHGQSDARVTKQLPDARGSSRKPVDVTFLDRL